MKKTELMEFAETARKNVQERLGERYDTFLKMVEKNNGKQMLALCIQRVGSNTVALVYMKDYLEPYKKGIDIGYIADLIVKRFHKKADMDIKLEQICDYKKVKELLAVRVINTEKNRSFLEQVPHEKFLDLSIVPVILWTDVNGDSGIIAIKRSLIPFWGITEKELLTLAKENTKKVAPYKIFNLYEIITDYSLSKEKTPEWMHRVMVLTNKQNNLGAAAILCSEALDEAWNKFCKKDFYVLPVSIHEVLLLPRDNRISMEEIKAIVNSTHSETSEEEFLSNAIYIYRAEYRKLEIVNSEES